METLEKTLRANPMLLSGLPTYESLYTAESLTIIRAIRIIYDEASSADAGVIIRVGKIGSPSFFSTYTTEASMAAGTVVNMNMAATLMLQINETLTVECDGLKTGVGIVSVQIEIKHNIVS